MLKSPAECWPLLVALALIPSCAERHSRLAPASPPALPAISTTSPTELSKEDQVRLAALRYLLAGRKPVREAGKPGGFGALYLSVGYPAYEDPSDALVASARACGYPVKKVSKCDNRGLGGVRDKATGKRGRIVWVGIIKWSDANTATFWAGCWDGPESAYGREMKARKKGSTWKIHPTGTAWISCASVLSRNVAT